MKVTKEVYESMIKEALSRYKEVFNQQQPRREIDFAITLTPHKVNPRKVTQKLLNEKVMAKQMTQEEAQTELNKFPNKNLNVRLMRLVRIEIVTTFRIPAEEEFVPGFVVQSLREGLDVQRTKGWHEMEWTSKEVPDEKERKAKFRVETKKHFEHLIFSQQYTFTSMKEIANEEKWMKMLYMELFGQLLGGGIEYSEALRVMNERKKMEAHIQQEVERDKRKEDATAKQSDLVDSPGLEVVKTIRGKTPMSKDDKEYAKWVKAEKAKAGIDEKGNPIK